MKFSVGLALTVILGATASSIGGALAQETGGTVPESLYRDSSPGVFEEEPKKKNDEPVNTFKGYNTADPNAVPEFPTRQTETQTNGDVQGAMIDPGATPGCAEDEDEKDCAKKAGSLTGLSKEEKKLLKGIIGDVFGGGLGSVTGGGKKKGSIGNSAEAVLQNQERLDQVMREEAAKVREYWVHDEHGPYPNEDVQIAMAQFFQVLLNYTTAPQFPWSITVVNKPIVNAAAGHAGIVMVNPGAIHISDNPLQLASVLAHEMGHVEYYHVMDDDLEALFHKAYTKGDPAATDQLINLLKQRDSTKEYAKIHFGRAQEEQADSRVAELFGFAGWDLREAAAYKFKSILYVLESGAKLRTDARESTHPLTQERIRFHLANSGTQSVRNSNFNWPGWERLKREFPTPDRFKTSYDTDGMPIIQGTRLDEGLHYVDKAVSLLRRIDASQ